MSSVEPEKNNTALVVAKLEKEIELLKEKKSLTDLAQGKTTTYIKDKVYRNRKLWWETWEDMIRSAEASERKTALIEYNKLQARVLPTQLEASNGQSVVVNVIGMGIDQTQDNVSQEAIYEAEVVDNNYSKENAD